MQALRFVWETLVVIAIIGCLIVFVILALIAEAGEKLFSLTSSAFTALVGRLGDRLMKEET